MTRRRVVITGVGVVSPLGLDAPSARAAAATGRSCVGPLSACGGSAGGRGVGGEVRGADPRQWFTAPKALKMTDRPAQFAVGAAQEALADAGWEHDRDRSAVGVISGTSGHDLLLHDIAAAIGPDPEGRAVTDIAWCAERLMDGLPPLWLVTVLPNMVSAQVAMQTGAAGPCSSLMSAEAAGLQAIGEAADWIRAGEVEVVLAGGADSAINTFATASIEPRVPGEGAAMFVLEDLAHAEARGARYRAEVLGGGAAGAGADGARRALAAALQDAGLPHTVVSELPLTRLEPLMGDALAAGPPIALALTLDRYLGTDDHCVNAAVVEGRHGASVALVLRVPQEPSEEIHP